jgi:hypothetical protein
MARYGKNRTKPLKRNGGSNLNLRTATITTLTDSPTWKQITQPQRHEILGANGIREMPKIAVGTTEEVLDTLRHTKLSELRAISNALPTRFQNAASAAAKLLEPKAQHVHLPGGTIKNDDDLKSWLADAEDCIRKKLKDGPRAGFPQRKVNAI